MVEGLVVWRMRPGLDDRSEIDGSRRTVSLNKGGKLRKTIIRVLGCGHFLSLRRGHVVLPLS